MKVQIVSLPTGRLKILLRSRFKKPPAQRNRRPQGFFKNATFLLFALTAVAAAAVGDPPRFKITTKKQDDAIEVRADKDKATFVVKSPTGIGQAVIERLDETWPKAVTLRLHLKGLESFHVSNGKVRLDAAVSSQTGKIRLWKDGKEDAPLDERSPFWTDIRIVGSDGKPARELPLKEGYFEITMPRVIFEGNPKTITVGWIDFYRG